MQIFTQIPWYAVIRVLEEKKILCFELFLNIRAINEREKQY